jgi:hypothetical protein
MNGWVSLSERKWVKSSERRRDWSTQIMADFEKRDYQVAELAAHRQFDAPKDGYAFLLMVQAAAVVGVGHVRGGV